MSFYTTDVSNRCDEDFIRSFSSLGAHLPISKIDSVVDGLDASGIDSIHLDAMTAHLFGDGKDRIGSPSHEPIGDVVLSAPKNSHVSAAPDKLRIGHGLGHQSPPDIGALKKCLNNQDSLLFEESS